MTNPELETSVQHLRRIYEPCVGRRNLKVNNSNHSATNVFYHLMFTLTVRKIQKIQNNHKDYNYWLFGSWCLQCLFR